MHDEKQMRHEREEHNFVIAQPSHPNLADDFLPYFSSIIPSTDDPLGTDREIS